MSAQPTDDDFQIRAAFENHCRSFGWSEGRLARWQVDDESLPPAVRGAYMIGSVQQMWQSWCAGAKWGTPATGGEPVAWRYQDARGHYRYRGYVPRFDKDYAILKPIPLYTSPQPVREPMPRRTLLDMTQCYSDRETFGRAVEAWHGITGGQHGTDS